MSTRSRTAGRPAAPTVPGATALAAVLALAAVAVAATAAVLLHRTALIDLAVYRTGGRLLLGGDPLYAEPFPDVLPGRSLPFTYPPFAALCFTVLAALPAAVVAAGWTVAGLAALVVALRAVGRELDPRVGWPAAVVLGCLAAATEPVWQTLLLGQVNLLLLAAVVVDALVLRGRRGQGALIGLAAAVKLTPAVFVLFLLAGRQWRAAATAVATAVGATALAALVAPSDSRTYWFSALRDPSRIGDLAYAGNQSVRGVLARLGPAAPVEAALWVAAAAAVLAAGWWAAVRWRARGGGAPDVAALLAVALVGLLASPVSWSHHWVWLLVALLLLVDRTRRTGSRAAAALAALTAAVALVPVHRFLPKGADRELAWSPLQQVGGSAVALLGLVLLAWLVRTAHRAQPVAVAPDGPPAPG